MGRLCIAEDGVARQEKYAGQNTLLFSPVIGSIAEFIV
jgi:hypothetical protein